jgi:hypothetical protein
MTDGTVTSPATTASAEQPELTQLQRVLYTFTAPTKTFRDILRNSSWWLPFLLSVVISYGFIFAMVSHVGWDKLTENGMKQNPSAMERMNSMPPDQRAGAMEFSKKITQGITYAIPILSLFFAAVCAVVLWGTINFLFGGHAGFQQVLAVWFYGTLPLIFVGILGIITMLAGMNPDSFNPQNPVGTNAGYYLSQETPKWISVLMTQFDIVYIWAMALVGIGLAIVAKVKRSSGLIAVFGWWVLITIIRMGIAAVQS